MIPKACEIGIAITTYNRKEMVCALIERIRQITKENYFLVVCDDGSTDGTIEALKQLGVTVIGGINKGIAWNKNRGLFFFSNICKAESIILMDDDVFPNMFGWAQEWAYGSYRVGHVNYVPHFYDRSSPRRPMTAMNLGVGHMIGGMLLAQNAKALASVGYMDTRFGRYGHEHTDFSLRFLRAGFGGVRVLWNGEMHNRFYLMDSGIELKEAKSSGQEADLERNANLLAALQKEPIYRSAWNNEEEKRDFLQEFGTGFFEMEAPPLAGTVFNADSYLSLNPDISQSGWDSFAHYIEHGLQENRKF